MSRKVSLFESNNAIEIVQLFHVLSNYSHKMHLGGLFPRVDSVRTWKMHQLPTHLFPDLHHLLILILVFEDWERGPTDLQNPRKSANPFGGPTVARRPHAIWACA